MRCKNCGWPNKPSATICSKCNSPLTGGEDMEFNQPQSDSPLKKTVKEEDVFGGGGRRKTTPDTNNELTSGNHGSLAQCPKCGYPLRSGVEKCPNCNYNLKSSGPSNSEVNAHEERPRESDSFRRPTRRAAAQDSNKKFRTTLNPYLMNFEVEPTFVLKPLQRMGERHDFEELEYEGKEVVLNRDNTEQNNPSITSKVQAVIKNVDGHWYIEDKSEQKTTFVQAAHAVELQDGDIILLGNRLFEFRK